MLTNVALSDFIKVPTKRTLTDAGQLIVPCAFARTGMQIYSAGQIGLQDVDPGTPVKVWRDEEFVFEEASIASFRSSPVTLGHPVQDGKPISVTAENAATYQQGFLEGLPTRDEDTLTGTLVITNQEAIDEIENGVSELSAGYTCDIAIVTDEDGSERYIQKNIRANHIAIVAKGRAGSSCRIADEGDSVEVLTLKLQLTDALAKVEEGEAATAKLLEVTDKLTQAEAKLLEGKTLSDQVEELTKKLAASDLALEDATKNLDEKIAARTATIVMAKDMTDLDDFSGKTEEEIRKEVVQLLSPDQDFTDKDDSYISARFDLLFESNMKDTPMGKLLRDNAEPPTIDPPKDVVKEARTRMVERQTNKSN